MSKTDFNSEARVERRSDDILPTKVVQLLESIRQSLEDIYVEKSHKNPTILSSNALAMIKTMLRHDLRELARQGGLAVRGLD